MNNNKKLIAVVILAALALTISATESFAKKKKKYYRTYDGSYVQVAPQPFYPYAGNNSMYQSEQRQRDSIMTNSGR